MGAFSAIKGMNYFVATTQSRDNIQAMHRPDRSILSRLTYPNGSRVPFGQFDEVMVRWELGILETLGFNNIRMVNNSMIAWILSPQEFIGNLRTVVRICADLGLSITYVIWMGTREGLQNIRILNTLLVDPSPRGAPWAKRRWQRMTDTEPWPPSPGPFPLPPTPNREAHPPTGTHFRSRGYVEPDYEMLRLGFSGGVRPNWRNLYRNTVSYANAYHGGLRYGNFQALVEGYLDAVDDVFRSSTGARVLISYDLFNEPERHLIGKTSQDPVYRGTLDLVCYTYRHIVARRQRLGASGGTETAPPAFTMGNGSYHRLEEFYRELNRRNCRMTYLSFHQYWDLPHIRRKVKWDRERTWQTYMLGVRQIADRVMRPGSDVVCSEFYAPYPPFERENRGNLGLMLKAISDKGMGGQIWSVLQTNFFSFPDLNPQDGLFVPYDPPFGVNRPGFAGKSRVLKFSEFLRSDDDRNELIRWTGGTLPPV